jgi:hypothetical protein
LVKCLWAARQLEESFWEAADRAFALVIEMRGALRDEWLARKEEKAIEGGDDNTIAAAKAATNTHRALNTKEAIKQATVPLLLLPPESMVCSPVIPLSRTLTSVYKASTPKCLGIFRRDRPPLATRCRTGKRA